jgi:hypothetical protein
MPSGARTRETTGTPANVGRRVILVLAGVAALLLKPAWHGPGSVLVHSYGGNVAASFAVTFLAALEAARWRLGRAAAAAAALLVVEAFELTDGFGVMSNVFDPLDLVANVVGVGLAVAVDAVAGRVRPVHPGATDSPA